MSDTRKVCFVIMGFGKKTDYESGRTLDLDATYEAIIEPAATAEGMRCIRADEIMHSGVIDSAMYEMLLRADLVIADISTSNANSLYELGVRHALRPNSTVIMKEQEGRMHFDLNHVNTFLYVHLGEDIGSREKARATRDLQLLVKSSMEAQQPDSPVYTFLPKLLRPRLSDEQYEELLAETEEKQEKLSDLIRTASIAFRSGQHADAAIAWKAASEMKPRDPFITQQLALSTYKSKTPSELSSLISALQVIDDLLPDDSNDPETLGITGAIYKRLWLIAKDPVHLDLSIKHYRRGFEVRRDYYNGENLSSCYDFKADIQADPLESVFFRTSARKVRAEVTVALESIIGSESFHERSDRRWIFATLSNLYLRDGFIDQANLYEGFFLTSDPAGWEIDTFNETRARMISGPI